jgi:hypothetical protein
LNPAVIIAAVKPNPKRGQRRLPAMVAGARELWGLPRLFSRLNRCVNILIIIDCRLKY